MITAAALYQPSESFLPNPQQFSAAQIFNNAVTTAHNSFLERNKEDLIKATLEQRPSNEAKQPFTNESVGSKQNELVQSLFKPSSVQGSNAFAGSSQDAPSGETGYQSGADLRAGLVENAKRLEGFTPKAQYDYQQYSVGYGTRAKSPNEVIDQQEAENRLKQELDYHKQRVARINKQNNYNFSESQIEALTLFDHNVGRLEQLTDNGKRTKDQIKAKIIEYNKAGGQPILTKRRKFEQDLFSQQ